MNRDSFYALMLLIIAFNTCDADQPHWTMETESCLKPPTDPSANSELLKPNISSRAGGFLMW